MFQISAQLDAIWPMQKIIGLNSLDQLGLSVKSEYLQSLLATPKP